MSECITYLPHAKAAFEQLPYDFLHFTSVYM